MSDNAQVIVPENKEINNKFSVVHEDDEYSKGGVPNV